MNIQEQARKILLHAIIASQILLIFVNGPMLFLMPHASMVSYLLNKIGGCDSKHSLIPMWDTSCLIFMLLVAPLMLYIMHFMGENYSAIGFLCLSRHQPRLFSFTCLLILNPQTCLVPTQFFQMVQLPCESLTANTWEALAGLQAPTVQYKIDTVLESK